MSNDSAIFALYNKPGRAIGILAASFAILGSLALAAQDKYTLQIPNGLSWSEFRGYEYWKDVAVSQTETSLKVIAANDLMIMRIGTAFPATASFFPTAPRSRRSNGRSKRTLPHPIS